MMLRHFTIALFALSAITSAQGCIFGLCGGQYYETEEYGHMGEPMDVSGGALGGDFGTVAAAVSAANAVAYTESSWTSVELLTEADGEAKMAIVEVWGDLQGITEGETHTYTAYDDGTGGYFSVIGCAGPEAYEWDLDEVAEVVEVQVRPSEEDPTLRTYSFIAHFATIDDAGTEHTSTLTGRFDAL